MKAPSPSLEPTQAGMKKRSNDFPGMPIKNSSGVEEFFCEGIRFNACRFFPSSSLRLPRRRLPPEDSRSHFRILRPATAFTLGFPVFCELYDSPLISLSICILHCHYGIDGSKRKTALKWQWSANNFAHEWGKNPNPLNLRFPGGNSKPAAENKCAGGGLKEGPFRVLELFGFMEFPCGQRSADTLPPRSLP